jgi:hypothetical protein
MFIVSCLWFDVHGIKTWTSDARSTAAGRPKAKPQFDQRLSASRAEHRRFPKSWLPANNPVIRPFFSLVLKPINNRDPLRFKKLTFFIYK